MVIKKRKVLASNEYGQGNWKTRPIPFLQKVVSLNSIQPIEIKGGEKNLVDTGIIVNIPAETKC